MSDKPDYIHDTIVAAATPPGIGGIGIVRISGPAVPELARSLLGELPAPRVATFAAFRDTRGEAVDTGLADSNESLMPDVFANLGAAEQENLLAFLNSL